MKAQHSRLTEFITSLSPTWQERMGLSHFDIEHAFLDSFFGDDGEEDFKVTATTEVRWNYLTAKVKWYLPSAVRHDEEMLEKTLVHELCHVLLSSEQALIDNRLAESTALPSTATQYEQLQNTYYERMELSTEMVTKALWRAYSDKTD